MCNEKVKACREQNVNSDQVLLNLQEENQKLMENTLFNVDMALTACENQQLHKELIEVRKKVPNEEHKDLNDANMEESNGDKKFKT